MTKIVSIDRRLIFDGQYIISARIENDSEFAIRADGRWMVFNCKNIFKRYADKAESSLLEAIAFPYYEELQYSELFFEKSL